MLYLIRLWFGVRVPVSRQAFLLSGVTLALLKYAGEALLIWFYTSAFFPPWQFINPVLSLRTEMLQPAPTWVGWAIFVWSLPYLWIAITMSVRRAADSGFSPWMGLLVLVPLVNLVFMIAMCFLPSAPYSNWSPRADYPSKENEAKDAVLSLGISLMLGAVGVAALALLLFALEGVICIAMALPLLLPLGLLGGVMGKAIADASRRQIAELLAVVALLPSVAIVEPLFMRTREYQVTTAVEINAPPNAVWNHVLAFPDLPPATEWHFRLGIACPERARIVGSGLGAVRYCEFSTGTFVEPITAWEPGHRLAFDVTEQPAPMFELTPYRHAHPPHLDGYLRSKRGEFRLTALPDGKTRLEGRTWYEMDLFPLDFWSLWSDTLIHSIHQRVLSHVKRQAESKVGTEIRRRTSAGGSDCRYAMLSRLSSIAGGLPVI